MKELTLKKEILARLQDEEMEKLTGGEDVSNTTATKDQISANENDEVDPTSCCQKSCK